MTLWITEDETDVYLFSVRAEVRSELVRCVELVRGELLPPPQKPVEEEKKPAVRAKEEEKVKVPQRFVLTAQNMRMRTKVSCEGTIG